MYECPVTKQVVMNAEHYKVLLDFYKNVAYGETFQQLQFEPRPYIYIKKHVTIGSQIYRSARSAAPEGSVVTAFFGQHTHADKACYYGVIQYFFEHYPKINGVEVKHVFCFMKWFKNLGNRNQTYIDFGLEFWDEDFEELNELAILPVHKINSYASTVKF
ncbi:hypothetical protein K501DRAFT_233616, partial [Backusella circina FSU 941]